jgi:outer membrane receptor protein involved in Fe transport
MLKRTVVARSIAIAFGVITLGAGVAPTAYAQSNTTGSIYGSVGQSAGTEVVVENTAGGFKRAAKPDASGRYNLVSLPTGTYTVTLLRNGTVVEKRSNVEVLLTQGIEVSFVGTTVVEIRGSAIRKLDMSSVGSTTIFTAKELDRLPVASNVGAIIQLAPNTTRGDSRYGGAGAPSFGGAAASENAYYVNGFPVTTLLTQVGFSQLPFNAIAQAQVLTGGYGAEFGRSVGGVVNIITKRGTNDFEVGGQVSFEPRALRSQERTQYFESVGTALDGKIRFYNALNQQDRTVVSAYGSGAIIKDKLFFYASVENTRLNRDFVNTANASATYTASAATQSTAFQERVLRNPRYLLKFDFALTDEHNFEYTRISDKYDDSRSNYGFNYATLQRTTVQNGGTRYTNWGPTPVAAQQGSTVDIAKYTGYITPDLTITALAGRTRSEHEAAPAGYNPSIPQVSFNSAVQAPGLTYTTAQGVTANQLLPGAFDENKGVRFDVEYKLGSSHTLRAGIDYNKIKSLSGSSTAGGTLWTYFKATDPRAVIDKNTAAPASITGNALAQQGYYVQRSVSSTGSTPQVDQNAQYIEDKWQVNKDLLLVLGLRNEGFDNKNGDGQSYIKLNKQIAPRIQATWDPIGDQNTKISGSAGRYHVPLPTNVAIRAAGSSLNAQQNYVYTGTDPVTGVPTGLTQLSGFYSPNNELGQAKDPAEVAAKNMKGNYQDELSIGIERALMPGLNAGAKFTYRSLQTAIDDHCDDRPFQAWATKNNIDASNWGYNCALFNPGMGNTFTIDLNGDGKKENIYLSAADLGIPKVKRIYSALDFFVERPFDGKWTGKVTYTYSKNYGNTEGQTLSDIGQADVATTQAYDFPEFSMGSNGLLPNNRTHKVKAFGYYQATSEFGIGSALVLSSGRPKNCIGNAPVTSSTLGTPFIPGTSPVTNYSGYGSAYFYCNGVSTPRGSQGTLPSEFSVDTNIVYQPEALKGLKLKLDIFNLFNRQVAEVIEERYNTGTGIRTTYGAVQSYSAPRYMKLTATYDKKF